MGDDILILNGVCERYTAAAGFNPIPYDLPRAIFDLDEHLDRALNDIAKNTVRGVILVGGADIDKRIYSETRLEVRTLNDALDILRKQVAFDKKDMLELLIAKFSPKPVFGFCRGFQELHVALSNEVWSPLVQHLSTHTSISRHNITFIKDAKELGFAVDDKLVVNSLHHQGVYYECGPENMKAKYPRMNIVAISDTDLPETVEIAAWTNFAGARCLGVQYHPELMCREVDLDLLRLTFQ